jgi:hypothetical protein
MSFASSRSSYRLGLLSVAFSLSAPSALVLAIAGIFELRILVKASLLLASLGIFTATRCLFTLDSGPPEKWIRFSVIASLALGILSAIAAAVLWTGVKITENREFGAVQAVVCDAKTLRRALVEYRSVYGKWPVHDGQTRDVVYEPGTQKELMDALRGVGAKLNPRGIVFIELTQSTLLGGEFVDPWGKPYFIGFDIDGDGNVDAKGRGVFRSAQVVIWSEGSGSIILPLEQSVNQ